MHLHFFLFILRNTEFCASEMSKHHPVHTAHLYFWFLSTWRQERSQSI